MSKEYLEIGSHFSYDRRFLLNDSQTNYLPWENYDKDEIYTFSGRMAIELAIADILKHRNVKLAYLPSYCCKSMIAPFLRENIELEFYHVSYDSDVGLTVDIDLEKDCDIFLAMSYFGIASAMMDKYISQFTQRDIFVIEDVTHRLLSSPYSSRDSDYIIASIRKWIAIPSGGYIRKNYGSLSVRASELKEALYKNKLKAMFEKSAYLKDSSSVKKSEFMKKFIEFENTLVSLKKPCKIDEVSYDLIQKTDFKEIKEIRINNAKYLYQGIANLQKIKPLIKTMNPRNDCPLFLPIVTSIEERDDLQDHLINERIYSPVHWPKNPFIEAGIEQFQISLICDQRYNTADMQRILDVISDWEDNN